MSRLSKKPIAVPPGVTVEAKDDFVSVKGPKGEQKVSRLPWTEVKAGEGGIMVGGAATNKQARANVGTMWSLVRNAIAGVHEGYRKTLEIEGVGYRAALEGRSISLSLGYVNPVKFAIPEGIIVTVEKNVITITGYDKDMVGRTASEIRALKKPEPYKGKGIRYQGEVIVRKVGKKAASATTAA